MIIIIGAFCILALICIFYILFLNRGSNTVVPIILKILAAVFAAMAILIIDFSKPPETLHLETSFLILRNQNGELLKLLPVTTALNLPQWHAYNLLDKIWAFRGYKPQSQSFVKDDNIFDELLAAAFLKWMANHYNIHWEMEHNYMDGISGGGGHAKQKKDSDKDTTSYFLQNSGNGFLVNDPVFNEIKFPKGSKARLRTTILESVFTITNPHMTFTFKALRLGNSGISHSILGDKIEAHLREPESYYAHDYVITLDVTFSRFLRWSPQTNKQKEWMNQVFRNFERDFNWSTFKDQFRDAIEQLPEETFLVGVPLQEVRNNDTDT